jgi:hypothetical protein
MDSFDGATDFVKEIIEPILMDYFDWKLSDEHRLYVKSSIPKWPIIGYFTAGDDHYFYIDWEDFSSQNCYGITGNFSFPQMGFDANNTLYLAYLGILNGGEDGAHWLSHPFATRCEYSGTWSEPEYLVNNIDLIDREFAYLVSAGMDGNYKMHLMAQVDPSVGTYINSSGGVGCQSSPTTNSFLFSAGHSYPPPPPPPPPPAINEVENTLAMSIVPNPASGQATVKFEGKGAITVYNMLGQTVYHIENVENEKIISLDNMAIGVYFVTVRSGNATAMRKLVKN